VSSPPVTVVIPTRDRPQELAAALRAIEEQDYPGSIECVVVFDQSEPTPLPQPTRPQRSVRALTNTRTPGICGARNTGILTATGELVAFSDDDDVWLPEKLSAQVAELQRDPSLDVVGTGIVLDTGTRRVTRLCGVTRLTFADLLRDRHMALAPSTFLTRREVFTRGGVLMDEAIPGGYGEDYDWLLRAAVRGAIGVLPAALVTVRWQRASHWAGAWQVRADALRYLLAKHPEFDGERRGRARIAGQVAFALAAASQGRESRRWVREALALHPTQPRAYLALLVGTGALRASLVMDVLRPLGKGL
jgi:glycosyltransferase involved in cell wall biosynthesis